MTQGVIAQCQFVFNDIMLINLLPVLSADEPAAAEVARPAHYDNVAFSPPEGADTLLKPATNGSQPSGKPSTCSIQPPMVLW